MSRTDPTTLLRLQGAILDGFDLNSLRVALHPVVRWENVSPNQPLATLVHDILRQADAEGRIAELVESALRSNPNNPALSEVANELGIRSVASSEIVKSVKAYSSRLDSEIARRRLIEIERQSCLVEAASGVSGTGFLVGPDQILTHGTLFTADDGVPRHEQTASIAFSDVSASNGSERIGCRLTFASPNLVILQANRDVGRERSYSDTTSVSARARGWMTPSEGRLAVKDTVIVALRDEAVGFRFSQGQVARIDEGKFSHTAEAARGSIGAPIFDDGFGLKGMSSGLSPFASYSEGLSIEGIVEELASAGLRWSLSGGITGGAEAPRSRASAGLDEVVRNLEIPEAAGQDLEDDVWNNEDSATDADRWAWAEAAAVTAYFDPDKLVPLGEPSIDGRAALLLESSSARSRTGKQLWILPEQARVRALERLSNRGELRILRSKNSNHSDDFTDSLLGAFITGDGAGAFDPQDPDHLRSAVQVVQWLRKTDIVLPSLDELRSSLERATLLGPFRHLTSGFFAGRNAELKRLTDYVDGPDRLPDGTPPPPILLYAPGGMGKSSLLAHFILENSERDVSDPERWRPFVYLDFDRPELDARDRSTVLLAIVRYLAPQIREISTLGKSLVQTWSSRRRTGRSPSGTAGAITGGRLPRLTEDQLMQLMGEIAEFLKLAHGAKPVPLLLVLDTIEEIQYASPDAVEALARMITQLRSMVPWLRPILPGRVEIQSSAALEHRRIEPLDESAARDLLKHIFLRR